MYRSYQQDIASPAWNARPLILQAFTFIKTSIIHSVSATLAFSLSDLPVTEDYQRRCGWVSEFKYIARGELLIICEEKYREPMANMFYSQ